MDCEHKELKCMNCCRRVEPTMPSKALDAFIKDLLTIECSIFPGSGIGTYATWIQFEKINQLINSYSHKEAS